MKIDVNEIKSQIGSKLKFSSRTSIALREIDATPDVDVDIEVTNAQSRLLVIGKLRTSLELNCSRCAEKFVHPISIPINEQFLPEGSPEIKEKKELNLADLSVFTYSEDEIDLEEIIRQNIYSAIPLKPLCSSECKGLCPTCGENLNIKQCGCQKAQTDERLTPLLKFKNQT